MSNTHELECAELVSLLFQFYRWGKYKATTLKSFTVHDADLQALLPERKRLLQIAYGGFMLRGERYLRHNPDPKTHPLTSYGRAATSLYHIARALELRGNAEQAKPHIDKAGRYLAQAEGEGDSGMDEELEQQYAKANQQAFGAKEAQLGSSKAKVSNAKERMELLKLAVENRIDAGNLWEAHTKNAPVFKIIWDEIQMAQDKGVAWTIEKLIPQLPFPSSNIEVKTFTQILLSPSDTKQVKKTPLKNCISKLNPKHQ